ARPPLPPYTALFRSGWENCGGFVRTFTAAGGEIVDQLWNPLGTPDFSSYATQIASSGADVAFIGSSGGTDGTNFMRAYEDFGLRSEEHTSELQSREN